ncbi:MAG: hypothetical protein K5840_07730 [Eubacterium sp.]|nr:hypothetical protein [Eubacterium sp.]
MENGNRKPGLFKKILVRGLAVLGVLFIILMILPDDEEDEKTTTGTDVESDGTGVSSGDVSTVSVGTDAKSATVMIYMNGSDLESEYGQATEDISEMLDSGAGDNVNVIIQTMGTKKWQKYDIASDTAQTYKVEDGELKLVRDDLGQLDCTATDTLSEFIGYCGSNYPAERYIFVFWNHGGGPVYGFGYDQWQSEDSCLTIAEMADAFAANSGITFDIIGMDCCIMASLETCYALSPYCTYTLLSEDFESGLGWSYTGWLKQLEADPGTSTPLLGQTIVDDVVSTNASSSDGDSVCMSLFNESTIKDLYSAWTTYAYQNEDSLFNTNYSRNHKSKGRSFFDSWTSDESDVTIADYYISDMLALIEDVDSDSDEAKTLVSALKACVAYYGHSSDTNELTGLAVSLPYGDSEFYSQLKTVYSGIGLDEEYISWLEGFVSASGNDDYYDYGDFEDSWDGWADYESEFGSNISNGGESEYGYDYDFDSGFGPEGDMGYGDDFGGGPGDGYGDDPGYDDYGSTGEVCSDDWVYDYDMQLWYMYEGDTLYLYDDQTGTTYYYDEYNDALYAYDESTGEWYSAD